MARYYALERKTLGHDKVNTRRNIVVISVLDIVWLAIFAVYPFAGQPLEWPFLHRFFLWAIFPGLLGAIGYSALTGDWFERLWFIAGTPIVPVLVMTISSRGDLDGESFAWLWMLAVAPVLPFWIGAMLAGIMKRIIFYRRAR